MTVGAYEKQAAFFAALAHPARLRILDILAQGEQCVCHLSAVLQQRQAYVSQQLMKLKEAGLISDHKDGLYVYYHLADDELAQLLHEARLCQAHLSGDDSLLHIEPPAPQEGQCTCPKCCSKSAA